MLVLLVGYMSDKPTSDSVTKTTRNVPHINVLSLLRKFSACSSENRVTIGLCIANSV